VVIIGAGPAGLAAAHHLLRAGHACTIADRNTAAGGTLRSQAPEATLPRTVLDAEIRQLERSGVHFRFGSALGRDLSLDGLLLGFDAVLLAVGEISKAEGEALGLEMAPGGIKVDPNTFLTNRAGIFATGRAVRPLNQILRAMTDGQAAAELVHRFLLAHPLERPRKPFSSIMGRLDKDELKAFLATANPAHAHSPCDACAGLNPGEAASEATRCLRCDCRSSGHCALQSYAELYSADASRFRQQRRKFEQFAQPGGVIFEPGKCILCGICVKLTETAGEPLGLTFIGRGFNVRVAAPFDRTIQDGLQKVAADCVHYCPTGALTFKDGKPE
jgi:ferredoxin